jgi:hypothetical protein
MHFFANRYIDLAVWLPGGTYIDGNLSAIMYVSNYGLLASLFLIPYVFRKAVRLVKASENSADRPIHLYFLSTFVVGVTISGNLSGPLFLSIGWILGKAQAQLEIYQGTGIHPLEATRANP